MPIGVGGSEGSAGLGGRTELKDPLDVRPFVMMSSALWRGVRVLRGVVLP